jgi:hypothetical protein
MKKLLSIILASAMALSMAAFPALAADEKNLPDAGDISYARLRGRDGAKTSEMANPEIPVYGYVGPEDTLIDPDPDNPEEPPIVTEVNVSVPVKIIWAAFEPDAGTIVAPNYYIQNHSTVHDLKVKMESFQPRPGGDNTSVDQFLVLNLAGKAGGFEASNPISSGNGIVASFPINGSTTIDFANTFTKGGKWDFTLTGNWSGAFVSTSYVPAYDMVLVFSLPT